MRGALYICKHDSPLCDMPRSLNQKDCKGVAITDVWCRRSEDLAWLGNALSRQSPSQSAFARQAVGWCCKQVVFGIVVVLKERSMFKLDTVRCLCL